MSKHPSARRVHRAATDEDPFLSRVLEGSAWAREHGRILVIAGVIAFLAFFGFLYVRNTRAALNSQAAVRLDVVRATVQSGNVQLANQDLQKFVQQYGKTAAGDEARLMLGMVQLQAGEAQNAISTLEPVAKDPASPLGFNAAMMLASAFDATKQGDQADKTYLRIADAARFDFQRREALDRAARLRAEGGNTAGAIQLFERILATFDKDDIELTAERNAYEMRLAELRAQSTAVAKS